MHGSQTGHCCFGGGTYSDFIVTGRENDTAEPKINQRWWDKMAESTSASTIILCFCVCSTNVWSVIVYVEIVRLESQRSYGSHEPLMSDSLPRFLFVKPNIYHPPAPSFVPCQYRNVHDCCNHPRQ